MALPSAAPRHADVASAEHGPGPGAPPPAPRDRAHATDHAVTFSSVLRQRGCVLLSTAAVIGRLPLGMVPVAILLDAPSLAVGGVLAALYSITPGVGQPALGRLADRRGIRRPVVAGGVTAGAALVLLSLMGSSSAAPALVLIVVAGVTCPPLEGGIRTLWPRIMPDAAHVRAACTLDSTLQEVVYVLGPVLAISVSVLASPRAALATAGALTLLGSCVFAAAPACRSWSPTPRTSDWLGPLRPSAMRILLLALAFLGGTVGALDVGAVAAAARHDNGWLAGALPAAFALAGLAGGVLFVRYRPRIARQLELPVTAGAFAVAWLPLVADAGALTMLLAVVLPGMLFVPLLTLASLALTDLAPQGTGTEAVGWLSTAIRVGLAAGTALAGHSAGNLGIPFAAAAACALVLALLSLPAVRARSGGGQS